MACHCSECSRVFTGVSCEDLVHTFCIAAGAATAVRLCCGAGRGAAVAGLLDHMVSLAGIQAAELLHHNGAQTSRLRMPMPAVWRSSRNGRGEQGVTYMQACAAVLLSVLLPLVLRACPPGERAETGCISPRLHSGVGARRHGITLAI